MNAGSPVEQAIDRLLSNFNSDFAERHVWLERAGKIAAEAREEDRRNGIIWNDEAEAMRRFNEGSAA